MVGGGDHVVREQVLAHLRGGRPRGGARGSNCMRLYASIAWCAHPARRRSRRRPCRRTRPIRRCMRGRRKRGRAGRRPLSGACRRSVPCGARRRARRTWARRRVASGRGLACGGVSKSARRARGRKASRNDVRVAIHDEQHVLEVIRGFVKRGADDGHAAQPLRRVERRVAAVHGGVGEPGLELVRVLGEDALVHADRGALGDPGRGFRKGGFALQTLVVLEWLR
ncbi:hypothetical protein PYCCODRAFT_664988 [Trametes coccinea BRFM310]|uniref:Uncharacterized protein n=1 Tax=Trametes coccinea (strain BRFM310) TaxID=1353009 RepID=A0A1Y2ILH0_TRAC3|nr:hypothetical protein PYCCODRAFT_664988 [Trametes coccinea BRFM310]